MIGTLLLPVSVAFRSVSPLSVDSAHETDAPVVADLNVRLDSIGSDMIGEMRVSQSADGRKVITADLTTSPTSEDAPKGQVRIATTLDAADVRELLVSPVLSLYQVEDRFLVVDRTSWSDGYETVRVRDLTRNQIMLEVDVLAQSAESLGIGMFDLAAVSLSEGMRGGACSPNFQQCIDTAKSSCEFGVSSFTYSCDLSTLAVECSFTCREPVPQ